MKTFVEFVQPDAAVGTRAAGVVSGPSMMTLPPVSTVVVEPVIVAPFSRQRSPRVETGAGQLTPSIVRHEAVLSW